MQILEFERAHYSNVMRPQNHALEETGELKDLHSRIKSLVAVGKVRISDHGYDELSEDDLTAREVIAGIGDAVTVEEYPDYPKGPCVLLLQRGKEGAPIHVVWGIPKGYDEPAVLITAYRPDPKRWGDDYIRRR